MHFFKTDKIMWQILFACAVYAIGGLGCADGESSNGIDTVDTDDSSGDADTASDSDGDTDADPDSETVITLDTDQIDFTLGGLNDDLSEPAVNCMEETVGFGCISVTGIANGEPFEFSCREQELGVGQGNLMNTIGCNGVTPDGKEILLTPRMWTSVPSLLEPGLTSGPTTGLYNGMLSFFWGEGYYGNANQLNFVEGGYAGWAEPVDDNPRNGRARGTFAFTWSDEVPGDPECDNVTRCGPARIRGTFQGVWRF